MRQFMLLLLLFGLSACAIGESTGPASAAISVRLRDEQGGNVGRNQVILTYPASTSLNTRTGINGTLKVHVEEPGVYRIWVVPKVGYLASETLTRLVTVATGEHVVVDFTLFRASNIPGNPQFSRQPGNR